MRRLTRRQILLLFTLWTGIFCNYVCYSIIAPFFPQLAKKKGLSAEKYSLVFGAYSLAQIVGSFLVGKYLAQIGPKFVVVAGLFLTGGATVLFGCLEKSPGDHVFFYMAVVIRLAEGFGFAAYFTSVLTVIVETFSDDPGYFVGLTETVVTIGMIAGPPLGSFLYTIGGYQTPFIFFGGLIMCTSLISVFIVDSDPPSTNHKVNQNSLSLREYARVLRLPATILTIFCVGFNVIADIFILITLTSHLQQFKLETMEIGGIYLCLFLSYGLSSPLSGKIADKSKLEFLLQSFGCLILVVSFTLIGPVLCMPFKTEIWMIVLGLLLKGLGAGPLISCSYSACLRAAKEEAGMPDDFRTYSLVSSIVSFSIPLGNLVGGVSAGVMFDRLGMRLSCTVYAGIFLFLAVVCLMVQLRYYMKEKRYREKEVKSYKANESTPLCACLKDSYNNSTYSDKLSDTTLEDSIKLIHAYSVRSVS